MWDVHPSFARKLGASPVSWSNQPPTSSTWSRVLDTQRYYYYTLIFTGSMSACELSVCISVCTFQARVAGKQQTQSRQEGSGSGQGYQLYTGNILIHEGTTNPHVPVNLQSEGIYALISEL